VGSSTARHYVSSLEREVRRDDEGNFVMGGCGLSENEWAARRHVRRRGSTER